MIDLTMVTFMIPVKIDSDVRYQNLRTVLNYLNSNFKTNVLIVENDNVSKLDYLEKYSENTNLKHKLLNEEIFHRTKYLNHMINSSKTEIVVNYDADVLLEVDTIREAVAAILFNKSDFVYPYEYGDAQVMVNCDSEMEDHIKNNNFKQIREHKNNKLHTSRVGHALFARKSTYIDCFMENENFISWGPEDQERAYRFEKLGKSVGWLKGHYVYHLEHPRGKDSSGQNEMFTKNNQLWYKIKGLHKSDLFLYYRNQDYLKNYKDIR